MKVAFVSYQWGEICLRMTRALADHDTIQLWLAADQAEPYLHVLDERIEFHGFTKPRLRHARRQVSQLGRMVSQIHEFEPDVVHVQHGHLWFNAILHRLSRYPLVITVHDPRHHLGDRSSQRTPQRVLDYGFRKATQIIAHTETTADEIATEVGLSRDDIHVVPLVQIGEETDQAAVEEHDGTVLFFGRMWPYKGLEYLIRAQPLINEAVPEASFVIAGSGGDLDAYRRQMVDPEKFTVINEYVSAPERTRLFREASVVALPYVEATQSGNVPLAATLATPVVATAVGGLPEQVDDGRTGLLIPPRDHVALADAVIRLLQDEPLRRRLGQAAQERASREWSPAASAAQTHAVYEIAADRFPERIGR